MACATNYQASQMRGGSEFAAYPGYNVAVGFAKTAPKCRRLIFA